MPKKSSKFPRPVPQIVWCYECGVFPFPAKSRDDLYGEYQHCPACGAATDAVPADPCARVTPQILDVYIDLGIGLD